MASRIDKTVKPNNRFDVMESVDWGISPGAMVEVPEEEKYVSYQISASEALRSAGDLNLSKEERIALIKEAQHWANKAFLSAKENVFFRYLAICQSTCAAGLLVMAESDYDSKVVSAIDPEELTPDIEVPSRWKI